MVAAITLTPQDFEQLEAFYLRLKVETMELETFLSYYPNITRPQLAQVCKCSISTVEHWFGNSPRAVKEEYKLRLAIAHYVWSQAESEPEDFRELRRIWDEIQGKD